MDKAKLEKYYTDPLAAGWMIKYHKITYICDISNCIHQDNNKHIETFEHFRKSPYIHFTNNKWIIHPDSLHLLEPKAGDLVQFGVDNYGMWRDLGHQYHPSFSGIPIIQRDGIPFIWPEKIKE